MKHIVHGFIGVLALALALAHPANAEDKSLYERIGGYKGVAAAVDDLVDRIYVNGTLNKNPALKAVHDLNERAAFKLILATWVMENTGGRKFTSAATYRPLMLTSTFRTGSSTSFCTSARRPSTGSAWGRKRSTS